MTIDHLKAWVEPILETSYISDICNTKDDAQHILGIMNIHYHKPQRTILYISELTLRDRSDKTEFDSLLHHSISVYENTTI